MTVGEFLEVGEDENCTDAVCEEDTGTSLPHDFYNSLQGNEDSPDEANSEIGQNNSEFSAKEALKALGIVSTILDESNPGQRVALRVIYQSQREIRKRELKNSVKQAYNRTKYIGRYE